MESINSLKIGERIPVLTKTAYAPFDPDSRNVIHTDDYAKEYGMRGALVPGPILLSYVLEMLYNYFGLNWLNTGKIKASFVGGGAINGDVLTVGGVITNIEKEDKGTRVHLEIQVKNQNQVLIFVGNASCIQ